MFLNREQPETDMHYYFITCEASSVTHEFFHLRQNHRNDKIIQTKQEQKSHVSRRERKRHFQKDFQENGFYYNNQFFEWNKFFL